MAGGFICEFCRKIFTLNRNLRRYIRLYHDRPSTSFKCQTCNKYFSNHAEWHQHTHSQSKIEGDRNGVSSVYCEECKKDIPKTIWRYHSRTNDHKINSAGISDNYVNDCDNIKCIKSSLKNRIITYRVDITKKYDLIPGNFFSGSERK